MATKEIPFYNVDQSVGKGGANKTDDILLIQFFLTEIAKVPPHPLPPPTTPLPVNGSPAAPLVEWIQWFQNSVKKAGKIIVADGRVDRASGQGGSYYVTDYTMVHINVSYRRRFRRSHDALENASNCPMALKTKFNADDVT